MDLKKFYALLFLLLCACSQHESINESFTSNGANASGKAAETPEEKWLLAISSNDSITFDQLLLDHSELVNQTLSNGTTLLIHAVRSNQPHFAQTLITQGADVLLADQNGKTAIDYATELQNKSLLLILVPDQQIEEQNLLFQAVLDKRVQIVNDKLRSGVNPNFVHESGQTPLTQAVLIKHQGIVQTLAQWKDTDVNFTNAEGKTAFKIASETQQNNIVQLLSFFGAKE